MLNRSASLAMSTSVLKALPGQLHVSSSGLENSTRPLVFTSALGCRASENFDISSENCIFPLYANKFCDAGQVPILRYFEACSVYLLY